MKFPSKVDAWLATTLVLSTAVSLLAAYSIASREHGLGLLGPAMLAAIGAGLPLWLLSSTNYFVHSGSLIIHCGPFSWKVPLSGITRIVPTRSALSSPALSLDRLRVEYGAGKIVLVSPQDPEAFMKAISEAKSAGACGGRHTAVPRARLP
jgi:hypothetical protein